MTQLAETHVFNSLPSLFRSQPNILSVYELCHDLLIRHPHNRNPSRVLEHSQDHPRLDDDMQMQMMNGDNVGPKYVPDQVSTTAMITTVNRRARSGGEMVS